VSLRYRILIAMLAVTALSVGVAGLVARQATRSEITTVVDVLLSQAQIDRIADHRAETGSWDGVEPILERIDRREGVRLILATPNNRVIADTRPEQALPPLDDLPVDDFVFGGRSTFLYTVAIEQTNTASGALGDIDRWFLLAGAGALVVGGLAAIALADRITSPIRELSDAVERTRRGDRQVRVRTTGDGELGNLAASFNALADDLARAEAAQRAMIADAAHELRTPLATLRAHLEAVADGVVEPDAATIEALVGDVGRLGRLVDDLQDLALVEGGGVVLELGPVSPEAILARAARGHGGAGDGLSVKIHVAPDLPPVFVDETRMAQVFDNLLANAARYATTVELSAAAHEAGVNLVVSDDGPGIAEDQLETIFDRFHRVDPARSGPGAGLGLAIAGRLVELHGGTIRAERRPGAGATFVVWLPSHGVNRS
jgi:signal transduction histidine kinase